MIYSMFHEGEREREKEDRKKSTCKSTPFPYLPILASFDPPD